MIPPLFVRILVPVTALVASSLPVCGQPFDPPPTNRWGEPVRLFNGKDLGGWRMRTSHTTNWTVRDGELVNLRAGSNLVSAALFQDFRLHLEFNCPAHGNSGVFLRGRYEVQLEQEPDSPPLSRTGAIYNVLPAEGPRGPAGEWQSLDVELTGRRVTVTVNGNRLIDRQWIPRLTGGALDNRENEPGPIFLQGDHGPVRFRNIVVTPALSPLHEHGRFLRVWPYRPGIANGNPDTAPRFFVNSAELMLDPEFRRRPESRSSGMLQIRMEEDPAWVTGFALDAELVSLPGARTRRVTVNGRSTYFIADAGSGGESYTHHYPFLELRPRDLVTGYNALQFTCDQRVPSPGRFVVENAALVASLVSGHPDLARAGLSACDYQVSARPAGERFALSIHSTASCLLQVERVDYQGWYTGYDENGNAEERDWHGFTRGRGPVAYSASVDLPPFAALWDTRLLPSQREAAVRALIRFRGEPALLFETPPVRGLILAPAEPVRYYPSASGNPPDRAAVPLDADPASVAEAELHLALFLERGSRRLQRFCSTAGPCVCPRGSPLESPTTASPFRPPCFGKDSMRFTLPRRRCTSWRQVPRWPFVSDPRPLRAERIL